MDELSLVTNLPTATDVVLLEIKTLERHEETRSIHLYFTEHVGASIFENKVDCVERLAAKKWMLLFLIHVLSLGELLLEDFTFLQFLSLTSDEVSYLSSILHSSEHVVSLEGFLKFILDDSVNLHFL